MTGLGSTPLKRSFRVEPSLVVAIAMALVLAMEHFHFQSEKNRVLAPWVCCNLANLTAQRSRRVAGRSQDRQPIQDGVEPQNRIAPFLSLITPSYPPHTLCPIGRLARLNTLEESLATKLKQLEAREATQEEQLKRMEPKLGQIDDPDLSMKSLHDEVSSLLECMWPLCVVAHRYMHSGLQYDGHGRKRPDSPCAADVPTLPAGMHVALCRSSSLPPNNKRRWISCNRAPTLLAALKR